MNVKEEINQFIHKGNIAFSDEYNFSKSLAKVMEHATYQIESRPNIRANNKIRSLVNDFSSGFLGPEQAYALMEAVGIKMARQIVVQSETELLNASKILHFPLVQKIIGLLHKTDKEGVIINVLSDEELVKNYRDLMQIDGASGVLIQEMIKGKEVFIGAKRETAFPPLIMCGAGGIYIEALKDVQSILAPIHRTEAVSMINKLRIKPILQGMRGESSCNLEAFYTTLEKVSSLMILAPEITELDLNPLILTEQDIFAVDARIKIEK